MTKKEIIASFLVSLGVTGLFFYKTISRGLIPFPGDLLLAEYKPWRTYSYLGYLAGSVPHKAQFPDTLRQLYPWKTQTLSSLSQGQLPLWNPYNFSGAPLLANFQSAPLYPLNFLYFVTPQIVAWTVLVVIQLVLSAWFTYLYSRTVGLTIIPAWFASLSYGFSSFMTVWLEYNTIGQVILWLPLALLAVEKLKQARQLFWLVILLFSLTAAALAGHPQLFFYLLIFTLVYIFYRVKPLPRALVLALFSLLSLGLSAIQLVPGIELILNAARSPHDPSMVIEKILIAPWQLLMLPFPDIFGNPATRTWWPTDTYVGKVTSIGFIPLFFLPSAFRKISHPLVKFYLTASLLVIILVTANPLTSLLTRARLPIFSTTSPTLMVFIFSFAFSLVCAFGIDWWLIDKHSLKKLIKRTLQVILIFVFLWGVLWIAPRLLAEDWLARVQTAQKAILYATFLTGAVLLAFALAITKPKYLRLAVLLLLVAHGLDLFLVFRRFIPFSPKDFIFPEAPLAKFLKETQGIDRHWGYGTAAIEANFATQLGLFSPEGYDPLYPRWYGEFIGGSSDGQIHTDFTTSTRSDARLTPGFGELDLPTNLYRLRILDALGVKYILDRAENAATTKTFPLDRFRLVYEKDDWKVFENTQAAPRLFLTSDYQVYGNPREFTQLFFDPNFDPRRTVLLERKLENDLVRGSGKVEVLAYQPNEVKLQVETASNQLLFLSDTDYPGWRAWVDNNETEIVRANYAFRAIIVPAGSHLVRFIFEPVSVRLGWLITLGSAVIVIIWLTHYKKYDV